MFLWLDVSAANSLFLFVFVVNDRTIVARGDIYFYTESIHTSKLVWYGIRRRQKIKVLETSV